MSANTNPNPSGIRRGLGCVIRLALLLLVLFFLFMFMAAGIGSGQIDALIALTFGWLGFLKRTVPGITWNWDLIGMALFCVGAIILLGHRFAAWIATQIASKRGRSWQWLWRWTWCGVIGLSLLFVIGMCVGGAAHQIGWIAGSEEPWFERKPRYFEERNQMRGLDTEFRIALAETNTINAVRQILRDSHEEKRSLERQNHSLLHTFHILFVSTNGSQADAIIMFPRDPEIKSRLNGYLITDVDSALIPADQLPALLKERAQFLISF